MSYLIIDEQYFTPEETAIILGISAPTVRKLVRLGRIGSIRIGSKTLISKDNLRSFFYSLDVQHFDENLKGVDYAQRKAQAIRRRSIKLKHQLRGLA